MSPFLTHDAARSRLVGYVNGTLGCAERDGVAEHLDGCPSCRREVAAWRALAGAAVLRTADVQPPERQRFLDAVLGASTAVATPSQPAIDLVSTGAPAASGSHARHIAAVLIAQLGVVRRSLWATSAVVFALGSLVTVAGSFDAGRVLALLAPLIAAAGVSVVCGPSVDPRLEVALSTVTSPRLVLLARLVLVFAFDLMLAVGASLALVAAQRGGGLWELVGAWLGPMLLLSSLSLAVSVVTRRPALGITVGFGLWALRVLSLQAGMPLYGEGMGQLVARLWSTTLPIIAGAGILFLATIVLARAQTRT